MRRISQPIRLGNVTIGGGTPVVIQSMTKTDTRDVAATVDQIRRLEDQGCEVIRCAVPDIQAARALAGIKKGIRIPLVADIHFDHRLALQALRSGVDGLRINPGNMRDPDHVAAVARAAKERRVPIRIGINAGSLPPSEGKLPLPERMVNAALSEVRLLESLDFNLIKISLKAFDVPTTIAAYQAIADRVPYPLHLGITEAGLARSGIIRSSVGLGILLYSGIGDTMRVSLTAEPEEEVRTAWEMLKALGLRQRGATLVSCPTCGRTEVDLFGLAAAVEEKLRDRKTPIKVAVMGCVVNGPGEAKDADVGIACGKGRGAIFRRGEIVRTVEEKDFLPALMEEVNKFS